MMSRKIRSNARWIWRKQAKAWRGSCPEGKRTPSIWKKCRQSARKLPIEPPARGTFAGFRFEKVPVIARVQQMQDAVLVERQVLLARRLPPAARRDAQLLGERLQCGGRSRQTFSRGRRAGPPGSSRPARPRQTRPQNRALALHAFGQERVAVCQAGDGFQCDSLFAGQEDAFIVHIPYILCMLAR